MAKSLHKSFASNFGKFMILSQEEVSKFLLFFPNKWFFQDITVSCSLAVSQQKSLIHENFNSFFVEIFQLKKLCFFHLLDSRIIDNLGLQVSLDNRILREVIINVPIVFESAMKLIKFFLFFIRKSFQNAFSCVFFICMENICIPGPFFKLLKFVKIIKNLQNFHRINNPNPLNSLCIITSQQKCEHDKFFSIHFEFFKYFMRGKILNVIIKDSSKDISSSEQENI